MEPLAHLRRYCRRLAMGPRQRDSKAAAAIFCHTATRLAPLTDKLHGSLVLLFDVDEHTGSFGGARRYFEGENAPTDVAGVMIGYPGMDKLVVGGRGVLRAKLHVYGVTSHSGASQATSNAIEKAAHLIQALSTTELPSSTTPEFPLPGKVTVTAIEGGQGYSVTPDLCVVAVDIRTTPRFDDQAASTLLERVATQVDGAWPHTRPTLVHVETRWPAYRAYHGLHGTNGRIRLDTIPTVQAVYHAALHTLLDVRA